IYITRDLRVLPYPCLGELRDALSPLLQDLTAVTLALAWSAACLKRSPAGGGLPLAIHLIRACSFSKLIPPTVPHGSCICLWRTTLRVMQLRRLADFAWVRRIFACGDEICVGRVGSRAVEPSCWRVIDAAFAWRQGRSFRLALRTSSARHHATQCTSSSSWYYSWYD